MGSTYLAPAFGPEEAIVVSFGEHRAVPRYNLLPVSDRSVTKKGTRDMKE